MMKVKEHILHFFDEGANACNRPAEKQWYKSRIWLCIKHYQMLVDSGQTADHMGKENT